MKILKFFISPVFMGILFAIFAASMAVATFIENDFGSSAAYSFIYDTRWFELIMLLLAVNMAGQMLAFRLFRKSKITVLMFHLSFILIVAGSAVTRYTGWEGILHIREGGEESNCLSLDKFIGYIIRDQSGNILVRKSEKYYMSSSSAENYRKKTNTGENEYEIVLSRIVPNASEVVRASPSGNPVVSLMVADSNRMEVVNLENGEYVIFNGLTIGLNPGSDTDVTINTDSVAFFLTSRFYVGQAAMISKETSFLVPGDKAEIRPMQILTVGGLRIIPQNMEIKGILDIESVDRSFKETGKNALIFNVISHRKSAASVTLWDDDSESKTSGSTEIDGEEIEIFYGSEEVSLPFYLKLEDFILERYPGSNSPSGYKSNVVLVDKVDNIERKFTIFMNNILKYKGYRFYQSSYDQDEKGTILSVNHDLPGMLITYTGYGFLFLFIILSLLNRNSVFNSVNPYYWKSSLRKKGQAIILLVLLSGFTGVNAQKLIADKNVSDEFGKILVQDQKGRTKPLVTLSNDILRKVSRGNNFEGLTPMQVFLGVYLDFENWKDVPLVRISNKEVQEKIGISRNMASFADIVDIDGDGTYKLSRSVSDAYSKAPGERTRTDKEMIKVDERINIVYLIYTGGFLKIFPLHNDIHLWGSPEEALKTAVSKEDSTYLSNVIPVFAESLTIKDIASAKQLAESIKEYQRKFSKYDLPSESKVRSENLYYKLLIFERLFPFYATTGLLMLIGLIITVIRGRDNLSAYIRILSGILFIGFLLHTFGLGLRWYIAGHSPLSNGYESMIFVSWITLLAGFLFSRKSPFTLSATALLAGMTLMVAHLSFMDPEITNLVPVLKSYWLTLHVSVITGSYGFLGLGAILGIITMVLLWLSNDRNVERISKTIDDLTIINYKTLSLGLYLMTIGTFLGAVWANESWGRYWGWDPKETWSLITIIVYSFVIHSRFIPGLNDIFSFNLMSVFAFSSVLMTYFGVNYYLSGLHSYAGGDALQIPGFVYIAVIIIFSLSAVAYKRYRKWEFKAK